MKTIYIANLKENWHKDFQGLTEKAHNVLAEVNQILIYDVNSIEEAKQSIEDGYYVYLPPRWDDDFDFSENVKVLMNFCELIREIRTRAYCLMVDESDVANITAVDVSDSFFAEVRIDYEDIRINDLNAVKKITNLVEPYYEN